MKRAPKIPATAQVRPRNDRVDFWFSDDIAKWMPKVKEGKTDRRRKKQWR